MRVEMYFQTRKKGLSKTAESLVLVVAGSTGLEPAASCVTGRRSNQTELRPLNIIISGGGRNRA